MLMHLSCPLSWCGRRDSKMTGVGNEVADAGCEMARWDEEMYIDVYTVLGHGMPSSLVLRVLWESGSEWARFIVALKL